MTQKTNHIFVISDTREVANHVVEAVFSDLKSAKNCELMNGLYNLPKNPVLRFLMHVHTAKKVNEIFPLPFVSIWNRFLKLYNHPFKENEKYVIILQNNSLSKSFDFNFFLSLSKKDNIELVYFTFDPVSLPWSFFDKVKKLGIQKCLTYSKEDAEKYNMTLVPTPYSVLFPELTNPENQKIKYDACFVGISSPARFEFLSKLFQKLGADKSKVYFNLTSDHKNIFGQRILDKEVQTKEVLKWNRPGELEYQKALKKAISSNVIVEISAKKQHTAPTLRYYEAVVYNKKLLTNIESVKNYPFYNPKFMKIFKKIDDIDEKTIDWIKKKEEVNHGYSGEFSPLNFVNFM